MDQIHHVADIAIRLSVILFMVGNLLAIGLETDVTAALTPLRDFRFLATVVARRAVTSLTLRPSCWWRLSGP